MEGLNNEYNRKLNTLANQIACFGSEIEKAMFLVLAEAQREMTIEEITSKLERVGLVKGIEKSNIRKYLRRWKSHEIVKETYSGRPKRYKIEEIGIGSIIESFKTRVRIRPLRGSPRFRDKWQVWSVELARRILGEFVETYARSRDDIIEKTYNIVDTWLRKMNRSEANWTTLLDLIDEALYQIDPNLGYRFRIIGATPDYWERYSKIKDALDVHRQPYDKKILMDLHLQKLPDYILPYFMEGYFYGHGLTSFSKPFSISVDLRPFFRFGIRIPQYPADPPKRPDSVLAFCRKIPILCSQQSAGSVIINNCNTVVSPYLKPLCENELEQWLQNLIHDLYELYAIRPKDPTFCGLVLNYEKSPLEKQTVFRNGAATENTYEDFDETAKKFVDTFFLVYDKAFQKIIYRPYPRIFLRISKRTFDLLPENSIDSIKSILSKFGEDAPIYFINTESKLYKPNTAFSVEAQVEGYLEPHNSCFSGVSTFISVILPALNKEKIDVLDLCQEMFSSIARFNQNKSEENISKTEDQMETGILSMKTESYNLYEPQYFALNIGAFGIADLLSNYGNTDPSDVYRFLCKLKAEIKITETNYKQEIRLSYPPRKSRIFRAYRYFKTGEAPGENWQPPANWICPLPFQPGTQERLKWEARFHEIFDGGYVSRFSLSDLDTFVDLIKEVLESDILFFKIDAKEKKEI